MMTRTKGQCKPCDTMIICSTSCKYHKFFGRLGEVSICPYIEDARTAEKRLYSAENIETCTSNAHLATDGN